MLKRSPGRQARDGLLLGETKQKQIPRADYPETPSGRGSKVFK
jgi:hypothetical protein